MSSNNLESIIKLIHKWVRRDLNPDAIKWLDQKIAEIFSEEFEKKFYTAFSSATRATGKEKLKLSKEDLFEAEKIRKGWQPQSWTVDQASRILLMP